MNKFLRSPAYENCSGPMVQHSHGATIYTHPITVRTVLHCVKMAIMLDHRSTALGRDFNSQVLKHREFWIMLWYFVVGQN